MIPEICNAGAQPDLSGDTSVNWIENMKRYITPYLTFWVAIGAVYEALFLLSPGAEIGPAIITGLQIIGLAALLGVGVVYWASRAPLLKDRPVVMVSLHAAGAVLYSLAWVLAIMLLRNIELYLGAAEFQLRIPPFYVVRWHMIAGFALYTAMVAGVYTLRMTSISEADRRDAELRALRAQLNPHFLFNTLHTITMLFRVDPDKAEIAMETFSDLIRYSLHGSGGRRSGELSAVGGAQGASMVALKDEWDIVEKYVELESLRLEDRLRVSMEMDPSLKECGVPPLLLQPLVENAVVHAAAVSETGATINVSAKKSCENIVLRVENDGVPACSGFGHPGLGHGGTDKTGAGQTGGGIGLSALQARLVGIFGKQVTCSFKPVEGGRFIATIVFPLNAEFAAR